MPAGYLLRGVTLIIPTNTHTFYATVTTTGTEHVWGCNCRCSSCRRRPRHARCLAALALTAGTAHRRGAGCRARHRRGGQGARLLHAPAGGDAARAGSRRGPALSSRRGPLATAAAATGTRGCRRGPAAERRRPRSRPVVGGAREQQAASLRSEPGASPRRLTGLRGDGGGAPPFPSLSPSPSPQRLSRGAGPDAARPRPRAPLLRPPRGARAPQRAHPSPDVSSSSPSLLPPPRAREAGRATAPSC